MKEHLSLNIFGDTLIFQLIGPYKIDNFFVKTTDTFGNCQRPVFSLGVPVICIK